MGEGVQKETHFGYVLEEVIATLRKNWLSR